MFGMSLMQYGHHKTVVGDIVLSCTIPAVPEDLSPCHLRESVLFGKLQHHEHGGTVLSWPIPFFK